MENRKVAFSSSYWRCPPVQELLLECDGIYTANVEAKDELYGVFGEWRVHFVPGHILERQDVQKILLESHSAESEILRYDDLRKVFATWVKTVSEEDLQSWFSYFGWKRVAYDRWRKHGRTVDSAAVVVNIRGSI